MKFTFSQECFTGQNPAALMLVNRIIFFGCFFFLSVISYAQLNLGAQYPKGKKSWSLLVAPGLSRSKLPSGHGVSFAGNYYVNLKIREPYLFAYRIEASQWKLYEKGWTLSKGVGFSSYSYILYYDYDREASTGTSLTDRMDFRYAYVTLKVGKQFLIKKFVIEPYIALGGNFLVNAKYTYTNKFGGGSSDFTNKYQPWALGLESGVKFAYQWNDQFSVELRPMWTKVQRKYSNGLGAPGERLNYSFNVGLAVSKTILKKSAN